MSPTPVAYTSLTLTFSSEETDGVEFCPNLLSANQTEQDAFKADLIVLLNARLAAVELTVNNTVIELSSVFENETLTERLVLRVFFLALAGQDLITPDQAAELTQSVESLPFNITSGDDVCVCIAAESSPVTRSPVRSPTSAPTASDPTVSPTLSPTQSPTTSPSISPATSDPTASPTPSPTALFTSSPSQRPSAEGEVPVVQLTLLEPGSSGLNFNTNLQAALTAAIIAEANGRLPGVDINAGNTVVTFGFFRDSDWFATATVAFLPGSGVTKAQASWLAASISASLPLVFLEGLLSTVKIPFTGAWTSLNPSGNAEFADRLLAELQHRHRGLGGSKTINASTCDASFDVAAAYYVEAALRCVTLTQDEAYALVASMIATPVGLIIPGNGPSYTSDPSILFTSGPANNFAVAQVPNVVASSAAYNVENPCDAVLLPPCNACELGMLSQLTIELRDEFLVRHGQGSGYVIIDGDGTGVPTVNVHVYSGLLSERPAYGSYASGPRSSLLGSSYSAVPGDLVTISAEGQTLPSSVTVIITSSGDGALLSTISFHSACFTPINLGDSFGSIRLVGSVSIDGATLDARDGCSARSSDSEVSGASKTAATGSKRKGPKGKKGPKGTGRFVNAENTVATKWYNEPPATGGGGANDLDCQTPTPPPTRRGMGVGSTKKVKHTRVKNKSKQNRSKYRSKNKRQRLFKLRRKGGVSAAGNTGEAASSDASFGTIVAVAVGTIATAVLAVGALYLTITSRLTQPLVLGVGASLSPSYTVTLGSQITSSNSDIDPSATSTAPSSAAHDANKGLPIESPLSWDSQYDTSR